MAIARNASESAYPEMWRGLMHACIPAHGVSGTTVRDWAPPRNHCTMINLDASDWQPGGHAKIPWAISFVNTIQNYLNAPVHPAHANMSRFSILAWIKPDDVNNDLYLAAKQRNQDTDMRWFFRVIEPEAAMQLYVRGTSTGMYLNTPNGSIDYSGWIHVAGIYRGGWLHDDSDVYVNGRVQGHAAGSANGGGDPFLDGNKALFFGGRPGSKTFDGLIGSILVYNRPLVYQEIRLDYEHPLAPFVLRRKLWVVPGGPGPQTVNPTPVAIPSALPAPTISLGAVTLTPSPVTVPSALPAPTVSLGAVTVTPTPLTLPTALPAPSLSLGAVTLAPSPVAMPAAIPAPTVSPGAVTLAPSPVTLPTVLPTPSVTTGIQVTPSPVAIPSALPAPTVVLGTVTLTPTPLAIATALPAPSLAMGNVITPSPVTLPTALPTPTLSVGAVTLTPSPVTLPTVLPTPAVTISVTLTPSPVAMPTALPVPSIAQGNVMTPSALAIASTLPAPSLSMGAVSVTPSPLALPSSLPAPSVALGALSLTPSPLALPSSLPAPSLALGAVSLTPDALVIASSLPVIVLVGGIPAASWGFTITDITLTESVTIDTISLQICVDATISV